MGERNQSSGYFHAAAMHARLGNWGRAVTLAMKEFTLADQTVQVIQRSKELVQEVVKHVADDTGTAEAKKLIKSVKSFDKEVAADLSEMLKTNNWPPPTTLASDSAARVEL